MNYFFGFFIAVMLMTPQSLPAQSLSEGCGKSAPERVLTQLEIDAVQRQLIVVVPETYTSSQPHDLVIAFHGRTDSNEKVRSYFQLEKAAPDNTIFVYPAGTRDNKGHNHWWRKHDKANQLRDYELFDKILASIETDYCINTDKIYLFGHSLGATFVNALGCARANKVRAIVTVAGGIRRVDCSAPVTAFMLHNPKDNLVKIADGYAARDWFLKNNGFATTSVRTAPESLNCQRYGPEKTSSPVVWCEHHHDYNHRKHFYPHNWPSETAAEAFNFFSQLPETGKQDE